MVDVIHEYDDLSDYNNEDDEEYIFRLKPGSLTALIVLTVMSSYQYN